MVAATARVIAMRAQGEAEVAIEQGGTRFEGVRWVTPHQIAANQLIPLPEPARRGLVNAALTSLRPTKPWLQPFTLATPTMRRATEHTVLGDLAEPPRNGRLRSIIRTEEVDPDEPSHIGRQQLRLSLGILMVGSRYSGWLVPEFCGLPSKSLCASASARRQSPASPPAKVTLLTVCRHLPDDESIFTACSMSGLHSDPSTRWSGSAELWRSGLQRL
jgi:hypothetical protein